ncbi:MAG: 3TM-type holin [Gammaproteobacteria bacterium]|nr:3TM-type holin [Gammaproteobacteria bacterium]
MISIAAVLGLAEYVPGLVRLLGGKKAADVADKALEVAQEITGIGDVNTAIDAIKKDPELRIKFQNAITPMVVAELEADTKRLESVNATMRAESQSGDKFTSRWRPFFGYIVAITWGMQMLAISIVIVWHPKEAAGLIAAMASLSVIWGVALSVLGISVHKRSQDKAIAAGQALPIGIAGALAQRITGNKTNG